MTTTSSIGTTKTAGRYEFAANVLGCSVEEFEQRLKQDEPEARKAYSRAKFLLFGLPLSNTSPDVFGLSEEHAKALFRDWLENFPEFAKYC